MLGGSGLVADIGWAEPVSLFGLGACAYTSINSLGWALAQADRRAYSIPMCVGAAGAVEGGGMLRGIRAWATAAGSVSR